MGLCPGSNNNNNNVASAAREAGSVAELAASKKMDKYTSLAADYHFQSIAVKTVDPINKSASDFLTVLAHKISQRSGDERETVYFSAFLFCCSDSTAFCFTIRLFVWTVRSNGHSYNFLCQFFPNPSGSLILRIK